VRVAEFFSAREHAFAPHAHECSMLSLLLAGSYRERCGRRALEYHPFLLAYHPAGSEHEDRFGPQGGTLLVIEVRCSASLAELPQLRKGGVRPVESAPALAAAWALRHELIETKLACAMTVEGLLFDLLTAAARETQSAAIGRPPWLRRVTERLREEYRSPVPLAALARDAGVHVGHLWRSFRRVEGCSPTTYVQRLRCTYVLRRLGELRGNARLADLALEAGFSDQSHLNRIFRRVMGSSPGCLRRELLAA